MRELPFEQPLDPDAPASMEEFNKSWLREVVSFRLKAAEDPNHEAAGHVAPARTEDVPRFSQVRRAFVSRPHTHLRLCWRLARAS